MTDPRGWHDFDYVHTDIPDGMTIGGVAQRGAPPNGSRRA